MKITALEYHDVVLPGSHESSGMRVVGAHRYKIEESDFKQHLAAIRDSGRKPQDIGRVLSDPHIDPFVLTFDDGGTSAIRITEMLEDLGWHGHFFVPTDFIGTDGFLRVQQLRAIRAGGHVIGTHSRSHPMKMSGHTWEQLLEEWGGSRRALEDILGEEVTVGSVPGGYYSKLVAQAAAEVGIRVLFTSEPTTKTQNINGCVVIGRYAIYRGMSANSVAALASGHWRTHVGQVLTWNSKKMIKVISGPFYLRIRNVLLGETKAARIT